MSSTARVSDRNDDDYYVTPTWLIEQFLHAIDPFGTPVRPIMIGNRILDPSAGGCEKYEMSYPKALAKFGKKVDTWDIRADSRAQHCEVDFLQTRGEGYYQTVITNPPFSIAQEFVYKALEHVCSDGYVIMLQRLNWLGTKKRLSMWTELPLDSVFVHHKRPGFNPEKPNKTDSIEYAHFVFSKSKRRCVHPNLFVI
ncbi:SAM-dependent methyltransferase [Pseudoalteromonas sp. S16_S37]|uniref:SAM-dependent methyltransferase n=1 Tax=Pseudoalteromonas sp. S16_S37 TaxID=2720228 RepID=UPI00168026A3|nr:SAM-dependent methyltransferase [Pseudoalteromonas sp. S16_S37]MBD1582780.1 SAM-dependent methyltransferase [Pseudoalteromonas sp. S16_S37]